MSDGNGTSPAVQLVEIKPAEPGVVKREFVPYHRVGRIYEAIEGGWYATLVDGSEVALIVSPV